MQKPSLATLLNAALAGSAGNAMYVVKPNEPYAFAACALAVWYGLLGVVVSLNTNKDKYSKIMAISASVMEIAPLSLFNIELYKTSESYSDLSPVFFFFLLPLLFDLMAQLTSGFNGTPEILKDLMIVANCVALVFLGYNEEVNIYMAMGAAMFMSKFGGYLVEYLAEDTSDNTTVFFYSIFFGLVGVQF